MTQVRIQTRLNRQPFHHPNTQRVLHQRSCPAAFAAFLAWSLAPHAKAPAFHVWDGPLLTKKLNSDWFDWALKYCPGEALLELTTWFKKTWHPAYAKQLMGNADLAGNTVHPATKKISNPIVADAYKRALS